jgi:hypothetical protein
MLPALGLMEKANSTDDATGEGGESAVSAASPVLEEAGDHFQVTATARLPDGAARTWRIREDSLVWPGEGG